MKVEERVINFLERYNYDVNSYIPLNQFNSLIKELLGGVSDLPYLLQSSKMSKPPRPTDSITFYDIFPIVCTKCDKESVTSPIEMMESIMKNNTVCPHCMEKIKKETEAKIKEQQEKLEEKMFQRQLGVKVENDISEEERGYFTIDKRGNYKFVEDENEVFVNNKKKVYYQNEAAGSIEESIIPGYFNEDGQFVEGTKPITKIAKEQKVENIRRRYVPKRNENAEIEHVVKGDSSQGQEFYGEKYSNEDLNEARQLQRSKERELELKKAKYQKYKEDGANVIEFNNTYDPNQFKRAEMESGSDELSEVLKQNAPKIEQISESEDENEILRKLKQEGVESSKRTIPE